MKLSQNDFLNTKHHTCMIKQYEKLLNLKKRTDFLHLYYFFNKNPTCSINKQRNTQQLEKCRAPIIIKQYLFKLCSCEQYLLKQYLQYCEQYLLKLCSCELCSHTHTHIAYFSI